MEVAGVYPFRAGTLQPVDDSFDRFTNWLRDVDRYEQPHGILDLHQTPPDDIHPDLGCLGPHQLAVTRELPFADAMPGFVGDRQVDQSDRLVGSTGGRPSDARDR